MKNRALLNELSNRRQFIAYKLIPRADGKTDKVPVNPLTGYDTDAQDSAAWLSGDEAAMWAEVLNTQRPPGVLSYGVGLVLVEGGGLFALDLDNCRAGDGWQPHVQNLVSRFPGAYVEVSVSGTGVHVIASTTAAPVHRTRNKDFRAELYTKLRFIAVTGEGASGSPLADCTAQLAAFAEQYFPPREDPEHGVEWTSSPVAEWRGPADDGELIARALRSVSAASVFGGRATFAALWQADPDILPRAFPPQSTHQSHDGSAADQALANHLAFWTGNDCERMLRLMRQSALVRPKWERQDYMRSTILRACADQREWYAERIATAPSVTVEVPPAPAVPQPPGAAPVPPDLSKVAHFKPGDLPPPGGMVGIHVMKEIFAGMCYVQDVHKMQLSDGLSITENRFNATYGGRQYQMTVDGQKPTKNAWEAYIHNELVAFPRVNTQRFDPTLPTGAIVERDGLTQINNYIPAVIRRVEGDPAPFLGFLHKLLPNGDDCTILLTWMAATAQRLGTKFAWCPFIQGVKGNGKTTLARILEYCISQRYTHWAKSSELHEKFNSVFVEKLMLIVDETRTQDQMELQEILKLYITSKRIEVRPMFAEKMMKDVCFQMFLLSNHQNGVRIDKDERRFAPFYCAQQERGDLQRDGLTAQYFIELNLWLESQDGYAIIYDYLMRYTLDERYNPAGACTTAPVTTSTEQALVASLGSIEQELLSAIEQKREGFRHGWVSSVAVDHLLAQLGKDKAVPRNQRQSLVIGLGYLPHPSLKNGGLCEQPLPDGTMPRLYITKGHPWAVDYLTVDQVRTGYIEAQRA